jgi:hypothetical protein
MHCQIFSLFRGIFLSGLPDATPPVGKSNDPFTCVAMLRPIFSSFSCLNCNFDANESLLVLAELAC